MRVRWLGLLLAAALCGVAVFGLTGRPQRQSVQAGATGAAGEPSGATAPVPAPVPPRAQPPAPAPAVPVPPPAVDPVLAARLTRILDNPRTRTGGELSLVVLDGTNQSVMWREGGTALLPASTQKLVPAAAALAALGPDYRYVTRVRATGPLRGGVLQGDLVLVGSGDPALVTPEYARLVDMDRPATPLAGLADQLAAAGVRRITGRVVGDTSFFRHQPFPSGWQQEYFSSLDAAPVSGLTVDVGRHLFRRRGALLATAAPDPGLEAAAQLSRLLVQRRVAVGRRPAVTHTPTSAGATLAEVTSPPLRDLLRHMVQESDNHLAEGIFRTLGAVAGAGTWAGADAQVRTALAPLGLDWTGVTLADGSGLSRDDRLTAQLLATLDARMTRSAVGRDWSQLMSVAGRSGTLVGRLRGTAAEGRLRGKTGTLDDVRALSGSVSGPGSSRYHFALLTNGLQGAGAARARQLQDTVVLTLAEYLACRQAAPAPQADPAPPGRAPAAPTACAA